ncbi:excalibur calcium-binding domain-containing protein [Micromonospora sp. NPDC050695]|uniref:excalibur calcium-binding domain-containing protein n=1 Tax=Micromonospora sp. NPDC050695 TaxID=3154938 RepID=UPI0033E904C6
MSKLNTKQKIGLGVAVLFGLCCCGSGIGNAIGGNDQAANPKPSPSVRVDQLADIVTASPAADQTEAAAKPTTTAPRKPAPKPTRTSSQPKAPYYKNCDAVRAAGADPLYPGEPGFRAELDRDGDGEACETDGGNGDTGPAPDGNVSYANCTAVRAAGAAPIRKGDPGYSRKLDRDGDGVGCE